MIVHEARLGFVHIPRTGGTSIERALREKYRSATGMVNPQPMEQAIQKTTTVTYGTKELQKKHATYHEMIEFYPDYKYYTVVRHPQARLESIYHFFVWTKLVHTPFEEWIYRILYGLMYGEHETIVDNKPYLVDMNHPYLQVDFIGKAEIHKLEEQTIWEALNIKPRHDFSVPRNQPIKWDKHSIKLMKKIYQKDYEMLNYE
jgi:hypothetical protein|tara:strand:+ start:62 stop:667 length:606 start_codon:yes stop_codon:yes gene_type:complete